MNDETFTITFTVDETPEEAFAAINNVRAWWSGEIEGNTDGLGKEFTYRYEGVHRSKQKITELIPSKKIVWHVLEGYVSFTQDKAEWTGTDVTFDTSRIGDKTEFPSIDTPPIAAQYACDKSTPRIQLVRASPPQDN
jgi:hypothetical protein